MVLDDMSKLFMGLGTIAIVVIVMFLMISEGRTQIADQSAACANTTNWYNATSGACQQAADNNSGAYGLSGTWNATGGIQSAGEDAIDWLPIIIITIIGGLLIGLVAFFRGRR